MISVIIPAYNEEGYIVPVLQSVRAQLVPHEIIVVCSGCTDNTEHVARPHADKVVVLKERGVSRARNEGAKHAKFDTLVFLDADTKISPKVLEQIAKHEGFGTARAAADSGKIKDSIYFWLKYLTQFTYSSCGLIFTPRKIFEKVGGFNEELDMFEDGTFLKRAKKHGKFRIVWAPVYTSTRRYEKKGYLGTIVFWIKQWMFPTKKEYDAVR